MRKILIAVLALAAGQAWALEIKSHVNEKGRLEDDINLPFADDPAAVGAWEAVDFVEKPADFDPADLPPREELYLKELVLLPGGKSPNGWMTWTRGAIMHHGDRTAGRYEIKKMGRSEYMFFEWKSGDYTIRRQAPRYYVLRKKAAVRRDNIDLPFRNDPAVIGAWESVDFVETPENFKPGSRAWQGELYLKELVFLPGGKSGKPWWTWTKGVVLHHGDRTASRYEIRKLGGAEYLFFEWKSGDYVFRGMTPFYYVLRKK